MELKEILAISGQPGLYKYVAQSSRGVIVESLSDGKRMNAASNSKVSALTEISIFTEGEDIPLAEVFTKIYEHTQGQPAISHKEAPTRVLNQEKTFFMSDTWTRSRSYSGNTSAKYALSFSGAGFTEFKLPAEQEA